MPKVVGSFKKNWHPAHFRDQYQRNSLSRGIQDYEDNDFQNWKKRWQERLKINDNTPEKYLKLMTV